MHMGASRVGRQQMKWVGVGTLLLFSSLGCGVIGFMENPAPLTGPVYWAAQTATVPPTMTMFLGMTTPVYPPTPIPQMLTLPPQWLTTVPEWITATATSDPPWLLPTTTPPGFTATPLWITTTPGWVTTTPEYITETPVPPWTTTPALPQIGFTTPVPSQTPYYRVGTFYLGSDVYVGGPQRLVFRLTGHGTEPSPRQPDAAYHFLTLTVTNYSAEASVVPVSDVFFIRRVHQGGGIVAGRWMPANEPLIAHGLPAYDVQQLEPIPAGAARDFVLGFVLPAGQVEEVGLLTDWNRPVEGALPVWFYLTPDPLGPLVDADQPPLPTSVLLDDSDTQAGDNGGDGGGGSEPGSGIWPTTGIITRGFGCAEAYTGVDGAGYGCPPEQPWFHNGVDIANTSGTTIWSPIAGEMYFAGPNSTGPDCSDMAGSQPPHEGLGNYQRLGDGQTLHYFGHLSQFLVTAGTLTAGQPIAEMGSTGCSTGSHLHWMVYQNGLLLDPAVWAGPGLEP